MLTASCGLATLPAMDEQADHQPHVGKAELSAFVPGQEVDLSAVPSFLRPQTDEGGAPSDDVPQRGAITASRKRLVRTGPRPIIAAAPDPGALPMATISPRRLLHIVAIVAIAWGVISFGRQVATASAASAHADALRAANAAIQGDVTAMQRELALIQERRYVEQEARAFRLGSPDEIPFALQPGAPALPEDAPGSASVSLGASGAAGGPLDTWLRILFGPG